MMKSIVRKQSGKKAPAQMSADAWQRRVDMAQTEIKNYAFITSWRDLDAAETKTLAKTEAKLAELLMNDPNAEV